MAERVEGSSSMNTSEATPPRVDDSPEMVSQPSPPEDERVTSSTDHQPSEMAVSPGEPRVSSSGQEMDDGAGPSNRQPVPAQSSSDPAPEIENQPRPDGPPNPVIRGYLEAPLRPPPSAAPRPERSTEAIADIVREAVERSMIATGLKAAGGSQAGSSQEITKGAMKRNIYEKSDDSNQQFDVEELSPGSKSSENADLESDSSPMGSGVHEERIGSGKSAADDVGMESDSSPMGSGVHERIGSGKSATDDVDMESGSASKIGIVIEDKGSSAMDTSDVSLESELSAPKAGAVLPDSETGTRENVGLEREPSSLKASLTVPSFEACSTDKVGPKKELSPSKTGASSLQGSGSATGASEKPRDNVSPKRKSPTKVDHLSPKRSSPFTSPDKQNESQMSTLLEELDIEGTKEKPGSSKPMEVEESEENKKEVKEQERNMEVSEAESQTAKDETAAKESEENQKVEKERERNMEVSEAESQTAKGETTEKESEENQNETEQESNTEVQETDSEKADDKNTEKDSKKDDAK